MLVANRLIAPASEHGLAGWLETDFVCDRKGRRFIPHWHQRRRVRVHPRQLDAWYRTLDQLHAAKDQIEVALYHRLRDLFSLKPDLVLYDITSTYFEGAGPHDFAKHGYSRDGKSQNVQVIVGMVMVAGWPIAHHVWAGNRIDHSTVQEVISDLCKRFEFGRLVFVGDRGMVTDENIESITKDKHGFLVGIKRRRNAKLDAWLDAVDDTKWIDCPGGINTRERKTDPPRTRAQEVPSGDPDLRVIVIDSDERRGYEQAKREQAMERARQKLEKLKERVASGDLKQPEKIGAAVERIMQRYHGYRYFDWKLKGGALEFSESETHLGREKKIEGKYVIMTKEKGTERPRRGGVVQGTDRRGERIPTTQGRAGHAADLSPDRAAGQGPHLRRGAGAAGPKTPGPTAQRGGRGSVPGAGDAGIVDGAAGELPPGGPTGAAGGWPAAVPTHGWS